MKAETNPLRIVLNKAASGGRLTPHEENFVRAHDIGAFLQRHWMQAEGRRPLPELPRGLRRSILGVELERRPTVLESYQRSAVLNGMRVLLGTAFVRGKRLEPQHLERLLDLMSGPKSKHSLDYPTFARHVLWVENKHGIVLPLQVQSRLLELREGK